MKSKRVLIAHQSTIPHYRVPFYNALEKIRPEDWSFDVVFDKSELTSKRYFKEQISFDSFNFPILDVKTYSVKLGSTQLSYQNFLLKARLYDVIVVENAINNIAYPLSQIYQLMGKKYVTWGHGKHRAIINPSWFRQLSELTKQKLTLLSSGFFAYTPGVKSYVESYGMPSAKVFSLNNTIDIQRQRTFFNKFFPDKSKIKSRMGLEKKKVLLFVGRFNWNKKVEFLLEAFSHLYQMDPSFELVMVGGGGENYVAHNPAGVRYLGAITDLEQLAPLYVISDVFSFPGLVGLGPLQALCYDLPIITIDAPNHMPEIEYLNQQNSIVLPAETTPQEYATSIFQFIENKDTFEKFKLGVWKTIEHLTIENMAQNFIDGINSVLGSKPSFRPKQND